MDNVTVCGETEEDHDNSQKWFIEVTKRYELTFVRPTNTCGHFWYVNKYSLSLS